jgi:ribosome modulation factor
MSRRMVKWLGIVGSVASVIGVALYFLPSNHSSAPSQSMHVPGSESIGAIAGRDVTVTVNSKQFKPVQSTDPRSHWLMGTWKGVHRQAAVNGQLIATGYTRTLASGSYSYRGELSFQSTNNGLLAEVIRLGQAAGTWKLDGNKFAVTLTDVKTQPKVLKKEGRPDTDLSHPLTFPVHLLPKFEDTIPRGSSQEYEIVELTQSTLKVRGKDLKGREVIFEGIRQ